MNQKILAKEMGLKIYRDKVKQYKQLSKIMQKILPTSRRRINKKNKQSDTKEIKQFWSKIWEHK